MWHFSELVTLLDQQPHGFCFPCEVCAYWPDWPDHVGPPLHRRRFDSVAWAERSTVTVTLLPRTGNTSCVVGAVSQKMPARFAHSHGNIWGLLDFPNFPWTCFFLSPQSECSGGKTQILCESATLCSRVSNEKISHWSVNGPLNESWTKGICQINNPRNSTGKPLCLHQCILALKSPLNTTSTRRCIPWSPLNYRKRWKKAEVF